jgi:hypothetical protein
VHPLARGEPADEVHHGAQRRRLVAGGDRCDGCHGGRIEQVGGLEHEPLVRRHALALGLVVDRHDDTPAAVEEGARHRRAQPAGAARDQRTRRHAGRRYPLATSDRGVRPRLL